MNWELYLDFFEEASGPRSLERPPDLSLSRSLPFEPLLGEGERDLLEDLSLDFPLFRLLLLELFLGERERDESDEPEVLGERLRLRLDDFDLDLELFELR